MELTFTLTYEFKLKPTAGQKSLFEDWLETNRQVYNYTSGERKDWYNSRKCDVNSCSIPNVLYGFFLANYPIAIILAPHPPTNSELKSRFQPAV